MNELVGYLTDKCCAASGENWRRGLCPASNSQGDKTQARCVAMAYEYCAQTFFSAAIAVCRSRACLNPRGFRPKTSPMNTAGISSCAGSLDAPTGLVGVELFGDVCAVTFPWSLRRLRAVPALVWRC